MERNDRWPSSEILTRRKRRKIKIRIWIRKRIKIKSGIRSRVYGSCGDS